MMSKILVTGSTGNLGSATINQLIKLTGPENIIALARNLNKTEKLQAKGVEIRKGDYDDFDSLTKAFKDVEKLYFVSGNDIGNRVPQHQNIVKAAVQSGIKHVVYTSFQRKNESPESSIAKVLEVHLKTEEWLKTSGLTYTILKHNLYMQVLPLFMGDKVLEKNTIYLPAGEGKTAFVSRNDLATAASVILTNKGHENKVYDLCGEKAYSFHDIASILSELTGQAITYQSPTQEVYKKTLTEAGVPDHIIGLVATFSEGIKNNEFALANSTVKAIIQRPTTSLKDFLKNAYATVG